MNPTSGTGTTTGSTTTESQSQKQTPPSRFSKFTNSLKSIFSPSQPPHSASKKAPEKKVVHRKPPTKKTTNTNQTVMTGKVVAMPDEEYQKLAASVEEALAEFARYKKEALHIIFGITEDKVSQIIEEHKIPIDKLQINQQKNFIKVNDKAMVRVILPMLSQISSTTINFYVTEFQGNALSTFFENLPQTNIREVCLAKELESNEMPFIQEAEGALAALNQPLTIKFFPLPAFYG